MTAPGSDLLILEGGAQTGKRTRGLVEHLRNGVSPATTEVVNLSERNIQPFEYEVLHHRDAFDQIVAHMLASRHIVFATPVYWYAMSGPMKVFIDRFTDLLSHRDPGRRGRQLEGRHVWLLANGTDPDLPEGFEVPFRRTATYLGMQWEGTCYLHLPNDENRPFLEADLIPLDAFTRRLRSALG